MVRRGLGGARGSPTCSGPSTARTGGEEAAAAGCDGLRLFTVTHATSLEPREDVEGQWLLLHARHRAVLLGGGLPLRPDAARASSASRSAWCTRPGEAPRQRPGPAARPSRPRPSLRPMVAGFDAALNDPEAQKRFAAELAAWEDANYHRRHRQRGSRPGLGEAGASTPRAGSSMELPVQWEQAGLAIDGAVWFRRAVDIPADWAGQDLTLSLGADRRLRHHLLRRRGGRANRQGDPRLLLRPSALHRSRPAGEAGPAAIAVRAFDHFGNGGFSGARAGDDPRPGRTGTARHSPWPDRGPTPSSVSSSPPSPTSGASPATPPPTTRTARRCSTGRWWPR